MTEFGRHFDRDLESEKPEGEVTISVPAVESLFDPVLAREIWPEDLINDERFSQQINKRRELIESLNEVSHHIPMPTTTIEEAIADGQIGEDQAERLYNSLSDLLEDDDYRRALLYVPFEFIPQASWQPSGEHLQQSINRFRAVYLDTWKGMLSTHDVRANFVDGDVIEVEQRTHDLPRVVKAAHLIPELIQSGLIETSAVTQLIEQSDDPILQASIVDTIPVLSHLGLIDEKEADHIKSLVDPQIISLIDGTVAEGNEQRQTTEAPITLSAILQQLAQAHADLDARQRGSETEKRWQWLRTTKMQTVIDRLAEQVNTAIISNKFFAAEAAGFLTADADSESQAVLVEGIRKAIESKSATDPEGALALFKSFKETLSTIHTTANPQIEPLLAKTLRRLYGLGVVDRNILGEFAVPVPNLAGPMSENIKQMDPELQRIEDKIIETTKGLEIGSHIFPAALVYGSRVKGYGESGSDLDEAIFVRPGTNFAAEPGLRNLMPETTQFWLEEHGDQLTVRNFNSALGPLGQSSWTHLLFGGAWVGDKEAVRELHQKLLVPYFYETSEQLDGRDARGVYLEEMEKDALQYRLMHRGYENFAPNYGGINVPGAERIDGQSMFWDSGYRRVALELFTRRVFLPKLTEIK